MKFSAYLAANLTPEWRKQYVNYEVLKDAIYIACNNRPVIDGADVEHVIEDYLGRFEQKFFALCSKELERVNEFFREKISESKLKFKALQKEVEDYLQLIGCLTHECRSRAESFSKFGHVYDEETIRLRDKGSRRRLGSVVARPSIAFGKEIKTGDLVKRVIEPNRKLTMAESRRLNKIKFNLSEFYLNLIFLQNFQTLNHTGFRKILKKYDKMMVSSNGLKVFLKNHVETAHFHINREVAYMIKDVENLTIAIEFGNRSKAMNRLRVPPLTEKKTQWSTFRFGMWFGMSVFLVTVITYQLLVSSINPFVAKQPNPFLLPVWRIFRGHLLVTQAIILLGLNIHFWRISGVNHVLIFELDPRHNLSSVQLMEIGFFLFTITATGFLGFLIMSESDHARKYQFIFPVAVTLFILLYLFNPFKCFYRTSRYWLISIVMRIVRAPFCPVKFADFWLADQMNSLVVAFLDFEYMICFYSTLGSRLAVVDAYESGNITAVPEVCLSIDYGIRPIIASLPAWFRFAQCIRRYIDTRQKFPHLVNAGKYSTAFLVTIFSILAVLYKDASGDTQEGPFYALWIVSLFISTIYTYSWDIYMDWGLLRRNSDYKLLREETIYSFKRGYYLAMVANLLLRFAWTLTVSVGEAKLLDSDVLLTMLAPMEVFRRFIWNFFRLENEHLNNCGQFRATRNISIKPIYDVNDEDVEDDDDDEQSSRSISDIKRPLHGESVQVVNGGLSKKETIVALSEDGYENAHSANWKKPAGISLINLDAVSVDNLERQKTDESIDCQSKKTPISRDTSSIKIIIPNEVKVETNSCEDVRSDVSFATDSSDRTCKKPLLYERKKVKETVIGGSDPDLRSEFDSLPETNV